MGFLVLLALGGIFATLAFNAKTSGEVWMFVGAYLVCVFVLVAVSGLSGASNKARNAIMPFSGNITDKLLRLTCGNCGAVNLLQFFNRHNPSHCTKCGNSLKR